MDRDTKKYELFDGNHLVYVGISNDIDRRANEHRAEGMRFTRVEQVGRASTRQGASDWETARLQTYMNNHGGELPKYNIDPTGK